MRTIVVGAGEVGYHLSQVLREQGHSVTLIEQTEAVAERVNDEQDVKVLCGNGSSASMLVQAGVGEAANFLAVTSNDLTNLVACQVAKSLGHNLFTVARIHDQTYLDSSVANYQKIFGIDFFLNPEALCAVELAKLIRHPSRVAVENFARGQIEVQNMLVAPRSPVIGKSLRDLKLDNRLRIGTITRDGETDIVSADTVLQGGDQLTVFGRPEAMSPFRQEVDPGEKSGVVRVVLHGASEISIALIRLLTNPRFRIRVIEKDEELCRKLLSAFPNVTVVRGDASSRRLLEEEQIGAADYFAACTKHDEENIMTCLLAAKLGVKHVQIVINKPDYEHLLEDLRHATGVERVVSPRQVTVRELARYLDRDAVIEHSSPAVRSGHLLEVLVRESSEAAGKLVKDLDLPPGCVLVALLHNFEVSVPRASDRVEAGDRIIFLVREKDRKRVLKILT